ncbi:MAG: hypothetical protein F4184_02065 [Gemmatimonadetes bacterium]|nr:hypothetical protein [Gemmatimonadota bacterium]
MITVLIDYLDKRVVADAEAGDSQRRATSRRGLRGLNIGHRVRLWQRQDHVLAKPQDSWHRTGAVLLAMATALVIAVTARAEYDPPITTLVTNMLQASGSDRIVTLCESQDGLYQGFRTGPKRGGYELTDISLYARDANESRYTTINAGLYHRDGYLITKVADLTRSRLDDFGRNEWQAPENTYLEPDADYYFLLNCGAGYANDNVAQFATTYSFREDSESREGWSLHDYLGLRSAGSTKWERDSNKTLRIRIKGRPSPDRAYKTEIISTPADGHTYRYGENIDIALTFNTDVYAPKDDSWIVIRVGDAASGPNTRVAEYLSGSDTNRLIYRYQVEFDDADANGISVDEGGLDTGFVGSVPTIVASSGLLPVERYFPGVADDPIHKVDGSLQGAVGMSSQRGDRGSVRTTVADDSRSNDGKRVYP